MITRKSFDDRRPPSAPPPKASSAHKITVEIDQSSLPPARPIWHESLADIVETLKASGDLTVRGAIVLLERLGVAGRKPQPKGRAA